MPLARWRSSYAEVCKTSYTGAIPVRASKFCMSEVTIGIEIELPWSTMLSRVDQDATKILQKSNGFYGLNIEEQARVQVGFDLLDEQYKELVNNSFGSEIYKGNDGYAEFAFRPKNEYQKIVETAYELYEKKILLPSDEYPLHITLGNVPLLQSSWLILMCLEFSGGTSKNRIIQKNTWERKGSAGILERRPVELTLGSVEGFEMRTLVCTTIDKLENTLKIAQKMGNMSVDKYCQDSYAIKKWNEIYKFMMSSAKDKNIDASYKWPNPSDLINPWQSVSEAIADSSWVNEINNNLNEIIIHHS